MHLDYFAAFCLVVKKKSITKAASELHLSQPALSLQINCLESRFGVKLLDRTNRGVRVTPAGELVFRHGKRMLAILNTLEQELEQIRSPGGPVFTIAASPTLGTYVLPVAMCKFSQAHPSCKYTLTIRPTADIVENLLDQTINIGLIAGPVDPEAAQRLYREKIRQVEIGGDEIVAVASPTSPWAEKELALRQQPDIPLLLPIQGNGVRQAIDNALEQSGVAVDNLNQIASLDNSNAIITAVNAGLGVGLVPKIAVVRELSTNALKRLALDVDIPLPFYLFYSETVVNKSTPEIIRFLSQIS